MLYTPAGFLSRSLFARAVVVLFALLIGESVVIALLNREVPNNLLFPIDQYLPIFSVIWKDNPWAALQLIAEQSILAVGHFDARSGLYLWTLEFDLLSLFLHGVGALIVARFITLPRGTRILMFSGVGLLLLSHTYVTVMAHCAGPTWAGFVTLYGLGVDKFPVNAMWQWASAIGGGLLLVASIVRRR